MKILDGKTIFSVTEINSQARLMLENMSFWAEGEMFSFKGLGLGYRYLYFDLKDPKTGYKISCILEPQLYQQENLSFEEGQAILVLGNLTLWEKDGRYQMYVHKIEVAGDGILLLEIEKLKLKLEKKGYFKIENKKEIPKFPTKIAVIASKSSDAWQDFKKHSEDKFPIIKISFFDVLTQGVLAKNQIAQAIGKADKENFDIIVIIRGGGSGEDLAAYNEEIVADAIFKTKTPIIVGVGHEKDVTVAQLVADVAASTPTDAAKIITQEYQNIEERLKTINARLARIFGAIHSQANQELDFLYHKLSQKQEIYQELPYKLQLLEKTLNVFEAEFIQKNMELLTNYSKNLSNFGKLYLSSKRQTLDNMHKNLVNLSPENILMRGYSITSNLEGKIIKSVSDVDVNQSIRVKLAQGKLTTKITEKSP